MDRAAFAGGPAALFDGRRAAGGYSRGHRAGRGYVRLRDADSERAQRKPVHFAGKIEHQESAIHPRFHSAGPRVRVPDVPYDDTGLLESFVPRGRDSCPSAQYCTQPLVYARLSRQLSKGNSRGPVSRFQAVILERVSGIGRKRIVRVRRFWTLSRCELDQQSYARTLE